MPFNPTEEGDRLDAASIDDRLAEAADGLNNIATADIQRYALDRQHLPALVDSFGLFTQYTGGSDDALVAVERYDNTLPMAGGGILTYLELFAPSGPYGPYEDVTPGVASENGWLIPRSAGAAEGMNVVLNMSTDLDAHSLRGIRATAWIDIRGARNEPDALAADPDRNQQVSLGDGAVYLGIGIRDASGTRHVIARSIRRGSTAAVRFGPMTTTTVIYPDDLSAGTLDGTVEEIFGVVLSAVWDASINQHASLELEIKQFNISVRPLRGGELT